MGYGPSDEIRHQVAEEIYAAIKARRDEAHDEFQAGYRHVEPLNKRSAA